MPVPDTDIAVRRAAVEYRRVELDHPFTISGRTISWFTLAVVDVFVTDRRGRPAYGRGASVLSVPWSWPDPDLDLERRDAAMRGLTRHFADGAVGGEPADPIAIWRRLHATVPATLPRLAALLCLGAVDNALHDAWARAANRPAHELYTKDHLADELGAYTDATLAGRYPGDFLTSPRRRLPVQHVVGVTDPLQDGDGPQRPLVVWLARDGVRHLKVKVQGSDPDADARRIAEVYRTALACAGDVSLAVDPNEGYREPAMLGEMLDRLRATAPAAFAALSYVEQPFPRGDRADADDVRRASRGKPLLADESLDDPMLVPQLAAAGWSGVVVKAGKGQSAALLTHAYARAHDLFVTVQDLTAVDAALAHSARLASILDLSAPQFEYNSRQYAPRGNRDLAARWPDLVAVRGGSVTLPDPLPGIY
jgi:L-alanine-DL-glutamate epimerase-like enolase superfamily enzyme